MLLIGLSVKRVCVKPFSRGFLIIIRHKLERNPKIGCFNLVHVQVGDFLGPFIIGCARSHSGLRVRHDQACVRVTTRSALVS